MNKDDCGIGQEVIYASNKNSSKLEFGVVTALLPQWAIVLYEGDNSAKSTYYEDLLELLVNK